MAGEERWVRARVHRAERGERSARWIHAKAVDALALRAIGVGADVVVKLEWYNPTGSYKDRMARAMIDGAERRGVLRGGIRVVEFTGGSTGSSLALVCSVKGYPFLALSSDAWSKEKLDTMRALG